MLKRVIIAHERKENVLTAPLWSCFYFEIIKEFKIAKLISF